MSNIKFDKSPPPTPKPGYSSAVVEKSAAGVLNHVISRPINIPNPTIRPLDQNLPIYKSLFST